MDWALFSSDGFTFIFRWIHFLAGITWIGVLYYFNFIQGSWFAEVEAGVKSTALRTLVPRALWWFRWGAMFTFLSGWILISRKISASGGMDVMMSGYGVMILTGALMGTLMWYNVWFVIWPAQKVVIASANAVASGGTADPSAAARGARAGVASRTNTLFSIPLLFMMGAASHLAVDIPVDASLTTLWIALIAIIGAIEINALKGKNGPMTTVKGVIHCGIALTVVLYGLIEVLV